MAVDIAAELPAVAKLTVSSLTHALSLTWFKAEDAPILLATPAVITEVAGFLTVLVGYENVEQGRLKKNFQTALFHFPNNNLSVLNV